MKFNKGLFWTSVSMGVIACLFQLLTIWLGTTKLWADFPALNHLGSVAFLGWASYYIAGASFKKQLQALTTNLAGTFWGIVMVLIITLFAKQGWNAYLGGGLALLIGGFFIVFQAHIPYINRIPLAFLGSTAFFVVFYGAGAGNFFESAIVVIISLIIGGFLGLFSHLFGDWLFKVTTKKAPVVEETTEANTESK